ncbi:dTDP-4-dehydrorhamnose 3,5-epimerase family protein [Rhodococcus sp. NPDC058521]|uniref:dTDP-4-dehydrorhamnose 3,5-epimerase family protein n=1 Tax=Rhodococcus sp. NPDC058521 TaxID=3346536 RepID=UPI003649E167
MEYRELKVAGAWEFTPKQFGDHRGVFLEWFREPGFSEATGRALDLQQANCSVSSAGVLRGIHFADVPPGQAKYVTCVSGAILDVVVDLRVGSPTFGQWDSVLLDDVDRRTVFLSEGLGHGFLSLADGSTAMYLCSSGYNPQREHGIHPLDSRVGIEWPVLGRDGQALDFQLSEKDAAAPSLDQAYASGLLPTYRSPDQDR